MDRFFSTKFQIGARLVNPDTSELRYSSRKNLWIESLRGFAIILVVFGHIIGSTKTGGMKVEDDSIFRYLYFTLEYIRMPLFTVISGWVYANKPVAFGRYGEFIIGKLRRLILPMFVMSTLLFICRMLIPGTSTTPSFADLPLIYIFPYDLYWYLESLLLIFLAVVVLERVKFLESVSNWLGVLALGLATLGMLDKIWYVPNFLSFKGAVYLFPFFICGIGFHRFGHLLFKSTLVRAVLFMFITGIVVQQLSWMGYFPIQKRQSALGVMVGMTGVYLFFNLRLTNNLLAWIGSYAYSIFLFHVFFTGGTRIMLQAIGLENGWVILLSGLALSLVLPILLEVVLKKHTVTRFCFLGLKPEKQEIRSPENVSVK